MKTNFITTRSRACSALGLLCLVSAALPACAEAEPRDLGFTQSQDNLSVEPPTEPFYTSVDTVVGRWVGQAEETLALTDDGQATVYAFPSGSTRIEVEVALDADYGLVGHITFGAGEPLPPVTNPDVGYPPGVDYEPLIGYPIPNDGSAPSTFLATTADLPPFEGFSYDVRLGSSTNDGEVPDGVVGFHFNANQPLSPWCAQQTSYPGESSGYSCVPSFGGSFESDSGGDGVCKIYGPANSAACETDPPDLQACQGEVMAELDCGKVYTCMWGFCACNEASCDAKESLSNLLVRRSGDELIGLFENVTFKNARGLNVPLGEVRLHPAP
jgi:hypothetical protein